MKHVTVTIMVLAALLATACSEVDLCYEEDHPHMATVTFDFDWQGKTRQPDSMGIVAYRIVKTWKTIMYVDTETKRGRYDNGDVAVNDTDRFALRTGDYKFMAFSIDTTELDPTDVVRFIKASGSNKQLKDCSVSYNQYDRNDPQLRTKIQGWEDYNAYAKYIQPDVMPIYYDTLGIVSIGDKQSVTCTLHPSPITQNVDIYFDINKETSGTHFAIDSVWAEIAGVPRTINLYNGGVDITNTNKMMFPMSLTDTQGNALTDSYTTKSIRCHGNIDVTSLVNSKSTSLRVGPGILQVLIYGHAESAEAENGVLVKKLQGEINLYNTINKAKPLVITEDGQTALRNGKNVVLDIKPSLTISGAAIVDSPDNNGGLDRWIATGGDTVIDI